MRVTPGKGDSSNWIAKNIDARIPLFEGPTGSSGRQRIEFDTPTLPGGTYRIRADLGRSFDG